LALHFLLPWFLGAKVEDGEEGNGEAARSEQKQQKEIQKQLVGSYAKRNIIDVSEHFKPALSKCSGFSRCSFTFLEVLFSSGSASDILLYL
jgi:hypothetical protein